MKFRFFLKNVGKTQSGSIGLVRRPWVGADAMGGGCAQCNITKLHHSADLLVLPVNVRLCRLEICVLCALDVDCNAAAGMCWLPRA